jgi:hypothetical protein
MKRARIGIIVVAALAVSTLAYAQAKPDFSGTWTLDPEASQMGAAGGGRQGAGGRGGGMMGGPMTVKHTGDTLVVERMQGENKVVMTYKLDGSQSKNTVAGRGGATTEQVSVAKWDGNKIHITRTQQMADQSVEITETWALEGGNLTIERTGGRGGATKQVYKKS